MTTPTRSDVVGLREGDDDGSIAGKHRVQCLDTELDPQAFRIRQQTLDPLDDHAPGRPQVLVGSGTADEDENIGAELGRFLESAPVVVVLDVAFGLRCRSKEAAAAQA
jgi:hypothetical protein